MSRTHSRYAADRGLTTRMVTTMFLIGLLYVVLVGVLLAVLRGAWPIILIFDRRPLHRPVLVQRPHRGLQHGRPGGHPRAGAGAARHRRPDLRPGRHAQAPGGDRPERRAERLRHRPEREDRPRMRHHRTAAQTGAGGAGGRTRARDVARRAPRCRRHDDRLVPRCAHRHRHPRRPVGRPLPQQQGQ